MTATILLTIILLIAQSRVATGSLTIQGSNFSTIFVVANIDSSDASPLIQVQGMLEHKGLLYQTVDDLQQASTDASKCSLIIVLGSTEPIVGPNETALLMRAVEASAGLIWIGQGLPQSMFDTFGLKVESIEDYSESIVQVDYDNESTLLFNETISKVQSTGAVVQGYFADASDIMIAPAELSHRDSFGGLTYYFAYDVTSWWFADPQMPWLRAYRLDLAIESILSEQFIVRLNAYPDNKQAVFITRIEDVDPLHTNTEWLDRANNYLQYSASKRAPLSVSLIPKYVDPQNNLNIDLDAPSAYALVTWLSNNLQLGGTVVQHGYTHQIGEDKTGVSPEFYNSAEDAWLSFEEQEKIISTGRSLIGQALGFVPKGFESPHYIANDDTYAALKSLGFMYVTQNTNTAFADRQEADGLINIPETLGYIPLNSSEGIASTLETNMDMLYNMGAVMLVFNHLFDDSALVIAKDLLNHALTWQNVWITNTDNLADFWEQRFSAYDGMKIVNDFDGVTVSLGSSNRTGLTITLPAGTQVQSVTINGQTWPVFTQNIVILPALPESSNTVTISLNSEPKNQNQVYGFGLTAITTAASLLLILKANRRQFKRAKQIEAET